MTGPGDLHGRAVRDWAELVATVPDDAWDLPTPCSDWKVRDLVNHVTGEELWTVPLLRGATIADVGDRFDGDVLGDDPKAASRTAAQAAEQIVDELLPAGGTVHLSYGEESMAEYAAQLTADHLIHGWDLAAALGADRTLDPELTAVVATWFADREDLYRSAGIITDRRPITGDPQADLLAAFGRSSDWPA
jgi:uncharacterized protein (TIGR03086 family)